LVKTLISYINNENSIFSPNLRVSNLIGKELFCQKRRYQFESDLIRIDLKVNNFVTFNYFKTIHFFLSSGKNSLT
jgi:hypothetical protein